jgi:hypothetical protein
MRSDVLTANDLGKAEKLIMGVTFNLSETRALISMYDRVLIAAASLGMWFRIAPPDWLFCWFKHNNIGSGSRFTNIGVWEPLLMYKTPRFGVDGILIPIVPQKGPESDHDCPKPLKLISYVVGQLPGSILDPFMGSGTTLRAAKDLGHKAIGIEIEEKYCEIAAKRMAQEALAF